MLNATGPEYGHSHRGARNLAAAYQEAGRPDKGQKGA